jgi:hypothetical protein
VTDDGYFEGNKKSIRNGREKEEFAWARKMGICEFDGFVDLP